MDRLLRGVASGLIVTLVLASCGGGADKDERAHRPGAGRNDQPTTSTASSSAPTSNAISPTSAPDLEAKWFETPSGSITCVFDGHALWCDIWSGLSPPPQVECEGGSAYVWLGVRVLEYGGASPFCASESLKGLGKETLAYGQRWAKGGISCDSQPTGLSCSNATGDGFFLSHDEWRTASSTSGAAVRFDSFQTPSGNIACARFGKALRCDIASGLVPEPSFDCTLDWVGMVLVADGRRAHPECAGDSVFQAEAPILEYGREWKSSGMTCDSHETGVVCWNETGHGFMLSRAESRAF